MTAVEVAQEVGIEDKTVREYFHQCRMTKSLQINPITLGGEETECEIDESYVGIRKKNNNCKGQFPPVMWVVAIVGKTLNHR